MRNLIRRKFTQTPNELINDTRLHPTARFLFVFLCSKPEDWEWHPVTIQKALQISKPTRLKYMQELKDTGWITTEQKKGKSGEFGNMDIILHPEPQTKNFTTEKQSPRSTFTAADKNGGGESLPLSNTDNNTNTDNKTNTDGRAAKESTPDKHPGAEKKEKKQAPKKEKKKPATEADLFGEKPNPNKKTLFRNSLYFELQTFKAKLPGLEEAGVDLEYYHRAIDNWSEMKTIKRTSRGWIATARSWMEKDKQNGKIQLLKTEKEKAQMDQEMMEYLNI